MKKFHKKLIPYLFISPFFIGYAIFFAYPVFQSLKLSFYRQSATTEAKFVGFKNFKRLLSGADESFVQSIINTIYYCTGSVFIIVPLALIIAVFLTRPKLKFREFFRLFFFTPSITSGVVVGIVFVLIFEKNYGVINNILIPNIDPPIGWLKDPMFVMPSMILLGIWKFTGVNILYFMVGLQNIPPVYRQAALIDGANSFQIFYYITLPLLKPILAFVITFAIIGSFNLFAEPLILMQSGNNSLGGPRDSGWFMTTYLYYMGFQNSRFGYASAIGFSLAVLIISITIIQLLILRVHKDE
tara:strand:+ start:1382 stop:2278 length:897 start_codon:yes stop_codon:yes gene_type:complete